MKPIKQKRREALARARSYDYDNSRAKRRGVSEEEWLKALSQHLTKLEELVR